jgi:aspartyl protease family protein
MMPSDQFGSLIYILLISALVALTLLALYRGRLGAALRDAALWLLIIGALVVGYSMRSDLFNIGERVFATLVPGYAISSEDGRILEFAAGPDGHFRLNGEVDGTPVTFIADTGATTVLLTYEDAMRAGIEPQQLQFRAPVQTANGMALAAAYKIGRLKTGEISRSNVPALIAQRGMIDTSLLGMTFLGQLSSVEMRGDRLILRD